MQERKTVTQSPTKKSYATPKLVVHGPVGKITGFDLDDLGMLEPSRTPKMRSLVAPSGVS